MAAQGARTGGRDPARRRRRREGHHECDPVSRQARRQRQVDIGKETPEYQLYAAEVAKKARPRVRDAHTPPVSPRLNALVSKREFDVQLRDWRQFLHNYRDCADSRRAGGAVAAARAGGGGAPEEGAVDAPGRGGGGAPPVAAGPAASGAGGLSGAGSDAGGGTGRAEGPRNLFRCQQCHTETRPLPLSVLQTESWCRACADDTEWIREEIPDAASAVFTTEANGFTSDSKVRLLVGGQVFHTTVRTVLEAEPDCIFAPMFGGMFRLSDDGDSDGAIRIDRPPKWFQSILDYCRQGSLVGAFDDCDFDELEEEARYFCMERLRKHIAVRRRALTSGGEGWRAPRSPTWAERLRAAVAPPPPASPPRASTGLKLDIPVGLKLGRNGRPMIAKMWRPPGGGRLPPMPALQCAVPPPPPPPPAASMTLPLAPTPAAAPARVAARPPAGAAPCPPPPPWHGTPSVAAPPAAAGPPPRAQQLAFAAGAGIGMSVGLSVGMPGILGMGRGACGRYVGERTAMGVGVGMGMGVGIGMGMAAAFPAQLPPAATGSAGPQAGHPGGAISPDGSDFRSSYSSSTYS